MEKVAADISKPHSLKHADTVDKSGPAIPSDVKVKQVDRKGILSEVEKPHDLKHADTVDKSAPVIEKDAKVGASKRPELMAAIKNKGQ
eukprot:m51a1_g7422 hypothetical protein (88) ;mRNA; r:14644-15112